MFARIRRLRRSRVKGRRSRRGRRLGKQVAATTAVVIAVVVPLVFSVLSGNDGSRSSYLQPAIASTSASSGSESFGSDAGPGGTSGTSPGQTGGSEGSTVAGDSSSSSGSSTSGERTGHTESPGQSADSGSTVSSSNTWGTASESETAGESTGESGGAVADPDPALKPEAGGSLDGFVLNTQNPTGSQSDGGTTGAPAVSEPDSSNDATSAGESGTPTPFSDLSGRVTKIEEDWELVVSQPEAALAAPQVGTVMTPLQSAQDFYLAFALNHRFNPSYVSGGMELQLWYQGEQLGWVNMGERVFATPNERVTWTQRLELEGSRLRFSVTDGRSATWGSFGQGHSAQLSVATTLTDLNSYCPNVSVANSGVTFAANRVRSLKLKTVRGYSDSGKLLVEDTHPVVVFAPDSQ